MKSKIGKKEVGSNLCIFCIYRIYDGKISKLDLYIGKSVEKILFVQKISSGLF